MRAKLGYTPKCKLPRCSVACYAHYAWQQAERLKFFLDYWLPSGSTVFEGSLHMGAEATPLQHRDALSLFLRTLRRRCPSLKIRWQQHITRYRGQEASRCHWDYTAYCPDSEKGVAATIRAAWVEAGGTHPICRPVGEKTFDGLANYQTKNLVGVKYRLIPLANGLKVTDGSQAFWGKGQTMASLDKAIRDLHHAPRYVAELLPEPVDEWAMDDDQGDDEAATMNCIVTTQTTPQNDPKTDPAATAWKATISDVSRVSYGLGGRTEQRVTALRAIYPDRVAVREDKPVCSPPLDDAALRVIQVTEGLRHADGPIGVAELAERTGFGLNVADVRATLATMRQARTHPAIVTPTGEYHADLVVWDSRASVGHPVSAESDWDAYGPPGGLPRAFKVRRHSEAG